MAQAETATGTSIDHKIQQQLNGCKKRAHPPSDTEDPESESHEDSEDDDVLLPGEEEEEEEEEESMHDDEENDESDDEQGSLDKGKVGSAKIKGKGLLLADSSDDEIEENENEVVEDGRSKRGNRSAKATRENYFSSAPEGTNFSAQGFTDLNLSRPLVKACTSLGYTTPTPIQAACIPLALTGRDICGSAVTGSGKTAAFSLPLLERLLHRNKRIAATYILVLTPTRELAAQVHSMITNLAKFTDIRAALVVGGLSLQAQAATLRSSPEIVVATPGRLIDHLRNTQSVGLEDLQALVLDEADRLLEMGFSEEINQIVRMAPSRRQTMLFSATMTEEVQKLITLSLKHPVRLAADAKAAAPKQLIQEIVRIRGGQGATQKEALLLALSSRSLRNGKTIIFFSTKQQAHRAKILFGLSGLPSAGELHGDMTQSARLENLERFRKGELAFLLATDVAARGLDILSVETVVNFDAPRDLTTYLHRIGRTARAGSLGRSVTFFEDGDRALLKQIVKKTGATLHSREVPAASVSSWQEKLEALETSVKRIKNEEIEETILRKAEMEAHKAENLMNHGDEIYGRPARTWFQSERQKKATSKAIKIAVLDGLDGKGPMTKEQQRNKDRNERRMEKKLKIAKEQANKRKGSNPLMEETASVIRKVKAAKAQEAILKQSGVPAAKAGRLAAAMVSGVKKKKKSAGRKELFEDGDQGANPKTSTSGSKVYSGGARSGKLKQSTQKGLLNKVKRQGKGKHSFKSKGRHKRR